MKKWIACLAALALLLVSFGTIAAETPGPITIVCTTFPLYDWTRQVLGEDHPGVDLVLLQQSGIDLHSFTPTAQDFLTVQNSDLVIYVGGHSDNWMEDALKGAKDEGPETLKLIDLMGDAHRADVPLIGMQAHDHGDHEHGDHEHGDEEHRDEHDAHDEHGEHEHDEHEHEHEHGQADEHIWLSLKNVTLLLPHIEQALSSLDPQNASNYATNTEKYLEKIKELDQAYEALVKSKQNPSLLFGDRYPFRYLLDDYGITAYAAFSGCSAENEASFQTVAFLADKVDELGLKAVLRLDGSDGRIAEAIVRTSKEQSAKVLELNAMQSITILDVENGADYLSIMQDNLKALEAAL